MAGQHTAREERQLSIPQLEVSFRNIPTAFWLGVRLNSNSLKGHTFGRFFVRGPAAWRLLGLAVREENVSPASVGVKPYSIPCGAFRTATRTSCHICRKRKVFT